MQSTGQTGMHSSQPVHSSGDDGVHQLGRAERCSRPGRPAVHSVQPMHHGPRRSTARAGAALRFPFAGFDGDAGPPGCHRGEACDASRRRPGGHLADRCAVGRDGLRIGVAVRVAAARALRLRQRVVQRRRRAMRSSHRSIIDGDRLRLSADRMSCQAVVPRATSLGTRLRGATRGPADAAGRDRSSSAAWPARACRCHAHRDSRLAAARRRSRHVAQRPPSRSSRCRLAGAHLVQSWTLRAADHWSRRLPPLRGT